MDPLGQYVYVLNSGSGTVSGYTISTGTSTAGQLIPMAGSPWLTTALPGPPAPGPISMAVDPLGRFLYVANFEVDSIAVFSIDAGTGGLTQLDVVPMPNSGRKPHAIAVDPAGGSVYVVNENTTNIIRFLISESTPWLVPDGGGVTLSTGNFPYSVVMTANGGNIYATNFLDGSISRYQVNSSGALIENSVRLTLLPNASEAGPKGIAVDLTSTYVYVARASTGIVAAFKIDNGMLVSNDGESFSQPTGISGAEGMAVTP